MALAHESERVGRHPAAQLHDDPDHVVYSAFSRT
jgi:hypothetical protein